MKKNVEIMFRCKRYFLVNIEFYKDIVNYIIKQKPLPINLKQLELEFERNPKFRRSKQLKHPKDDRPAWTLKDPHLSKGGLMYKHEKYMSLLQKSKSAFPGHIKFK